MVVVIVAGKMAPFFAADPKKESFLFSKKSFCIFCTRQYVQVGKSHVVGNDNRLQFRDVDILRNVGEEVYVTDGVRAGENLCLSALTYAVPGMLVVGTGEMAAL